MWARAGGVLADADQRFHGFVQDGRRVRRIDVPGAAATVATKVNTRGQVVGLYSDEPGVPALRADQGFLFDDHGFRRIAVAGAQETRPYGIARDGRIVGEYVDAAGVSHGFVRSPRGTVTTVDVPGATATPATDDRGRVMGTFADPARGLRGFVRQPDGTITPADVPDAVYTVVFGTSSDGRIAGYYADATGVARGFVRDPDGTVTTIDVPDARGNTLAFDVDDRGRAVGGYDLLTSVFLTSGPSRSTVLDAPGAVAETVGFGINGRGEIVGGVDLVAPRRIHGFRRDERGRFRQIDFPGAKGTTATRINDRGQVVGIYSTTGTDTKVGDVHGFLLDRGRFTPVRGPGALLQAYPTDIDDRGRIVGTTG